MYSKIDAEDRHVHNTDVMRTLCMVKMSLGFTWKKVCFQIMGSHRGTRYLTAHHVSATADREQQNSSCKPKTCRTQSAETLGVRSTHERQNLKAESALSLT